MNIWHKITFLLFLVFPLILCSQEKYGHEIIFLGEYTDQNELKVLKNDSVVFVHKDSLAQSDQLNPEKLVDHMERSDLYFIGEGNEPYWQFKINSSKLFFKKFDSEKEESYSCAFYYDRQSGFI